MAPNTPPIDAPWRRAIRSGFDGSFRGSKGNAVKGQPNAAADPATVSGEPCAITPLELLEIPGRRRPAETREPGDLPSIVVMREHIGRGASMETGERADSRSVARLWFVVTHHATEPHNVYTQSIPSRTKTHAASRHHRHLCPADPW
jgi:hypothetical protein